MPNPVVVRITGKVDELRAALGSSANDVEGFARRASTVFRSAFSDVSARITSSFGVVGTEAKKSLDSVASSAVTSGSALELGVAGAAAVAGAALVKMGADGISSFVNIGNEVRNFQRISGASAEDASRWVASAKAMGIESDTVAAGMFRLSRQVADHADQLQKDGVAIQRNADGSVDLTGTLLNVSDAYRKVGSGAEGNKIAFDAFGRAGASLIPVLAAGRDTLGEFWKEAADHGEIFSQNDVQKARDFKIATEQLHAAVGGLERAVGQDLVPVLTVVARLLTEVTDEADKVAHGFENIVGGIAGHIPGVSQAMHWLGEQTKTTASATQDAANASNDAAAALSDQAAATDAATQELKAYNDEIDATLGLHIKQVDATSALSDAETKLTDDLKAQGAQLDATTGKVETFQDALSKTADAFVSADEAQIHMRDSARSVGDALKGIGSGAEDAAAYMKRFYAGASGPDDDRGDKVKMAVDQAIQQAVQVSEAMATAGEIPDTAQGRKNAIEQQLDDLKKKYPQVGQQIDDYLARLRKVPNLTTDATTQNQKLSKSKQDLAKDTADLVGAAKAESDTYGTSAERHQHLIDKLEEEKQKYPQLAGAIQTYIDDVNRAWAKLNPAITGGMTDAFGNPIAGATPPPGGIGAAFADPSLLANTNKALSITNVSMTINEAGDPATTATIVAQKLGWNIAKAGRM